MTPMVDLGFLLLTFFVLTARLSVPTVMPVVVPADKDPNEKEQDKVSEEKILNLILTGKDRIYWYKGGGKKEGVEINRTFYEGSAKKSDAPAEGESSSESSYRGQGVRKVIFEKKEELKRRRRELNFTEEDPLIVLIKMTDDAVYRNMVDILDEMNITEQGKYMILDADPVEIEIIKEYEENEGKGISVEKSLAKIPITGNKK
jgi:biopolymer transport protein ExbD